MSVRMVAPSLPLVTGRARNYPIKPHPKRSRECVAKYQWLRLLEIPKTFQASVEKKVRLKGLNDLPAFKIELGDASRCGFVERKRNGVVGLVDVSVVVVSVGCSGGLWRMRR